MKVIMYMAMSANGIIAKSDDDTSWISEEEWNSYSEAVRSAGCLVVGRRTYHILINQPEFIELKDVKLTVVSKDDFEVESSNHSVVHSPEEALEVLKEFEEVVVAGGGILNSSFLASGLIDEIYLDIEPIVFGEGIHIFKDKDFENKLKLIGQKKIGKDGIQLHYKVLKD